MNPARYIHKATVTRQTASTNAATGQNSNRAVTTVTTGMLCLIEALRGTTKNSLVGRIPHASYTMTWSAQALMDGDLVTITGGPGAPTGRQFYLRDLTLDTTRPTGGYYTAILQERKQ